VGTWDWFLLDHSMLWDGHIIGTFVLSRDITEKKRAEEKLAALARELREKNEALEQDLEMARELQQGHAAAPLSSLPTSFF
jgi:serine phosphatase RsbU (regulator of sigma subunit)